jgi:hypothetical protein
MFKTQKVFDLLFANTTYLIARIYHVDADTECRARNERHCQTKREKMGHLVS